MMAAEQDVLCTPPKMPRGAIEPPSIIACAQEIWTAYQNMTHGPKTVFKKEKKEKTEMLRLSQ